MNKRIVLVIVLFILSCSVVFSQLIRMPDREQEAEEEGPRIQYVPTVPQVAEDEMDPERIRLIAISSEEYPVTPGDVYSLTFRMGGQMVAYELLVDSDYSINLDIIGEINAFGMTFQEIKPLIEERISESYNQSFPSLRIFSVGIFRVPVTGEIPDVQYHTAWGMTRLSEVIENNLGPYSSIRDIQIRSRDGEMKTYDLQMALNHGNLEENPFVKPGDVVILDRVTRIVQVVGGVFRPGEYQLLGDEGIIELESFFNGYTPRANLQRIKVVRITGDQPVTSYVDINGLHDNFSLFDGDVVYVPLKTANQPVVFMEGGIATDLALEPEADEDSTIEVYNRVTLPISLGDTLYDVLYEMQAQISPFANLSGGYLIRRGPDGEEVRHIDMQRLLYSYDLSLDVELKPFDRIAIPLRRPFVSIVGAVNDPGRYPYNPPELYTYYLNLAGGIDTTRNANNEVEITDEEGNARTADKPIQPGDTIRVLENDFLFNYNTYVPAVLTGITLLTSIIALVIAISQ
jgi:polysaccharide biosynthesis/export protein